MNDNWKSIETAPMDCPVLATWVNSHGNKVVGIAWLTVGSFEVEGSLAEWVGLSNPAFCWSLDPEGREILNNKPTHWMPLPEPPK